MKECYLIIDKRQIKHLTQKKPDPPYLKAQLILHKEGIPIRPIINNRTAPAYNLPKHLTDTLNQYIDLKNQYVITNATNLAMDLTKLEIHENHSLITFDMKDLYVNIPVTETLGIIRKFLQNIYTQIAKQILALHKEVLAQNYSSSNKQFTNPNNVSLWDLRYQV
jgi:hypothetical protein